MSARPQKVSKAVAEAAQRASDSGPRVPLYEKVLITLRAEIEARRYEHAGVLPAESALIDRFSVSRITVRRALDELARAGLVERSRGKVTKVIGAMPPAVIDLTQELEGTLAISKNLTIRVLGFEWVRPDPDIAETFGIRRTQKVLWITRLRSRGTQPIVHTSVHLPRDVGKTIRAEELERFQLLDVLRTQGKVVASADQILSAAPCPEDLAPLLNLTPGEPVFVMRRTGYDTQRRPMMVLQSTFRWDCIGYRMSLRQDALPIDPHVDAPLGEQMHSTSDVLLEP